MHPRRALRHHLGGSIVGAVALVATACGSGPVVAPPPWSAQHPDPAGVHFADASGLCAVTVRYPNDAPGEIDYKGDQYIQRSRSGVEAARGTPVATSGDWTLYQPQPGTLLLVTPSADFQYRSGSKCGSNSAAPT